MSIPGFTAEASAHRRAAAYALVESGWASPDGIVPAYQCGYYCDCDPGQCCSASWISCECKACGGSPHLERPATVLAPRG